MISIRLSLFLLLVFASCGTGGNDDGNKGDGGTNLKPPPECALGAPPAGWTYPAGNYGDEVGELFEDISLDNCDGMAMTLGDILARSELVLFNIGAGWCAPCIEETETLDAEVFREFCGRGLQVVQVLFQDEQSRPATRDFCAEWRERYTLSFPVLVDPLFETQQYITSVQAQTPMNFLIDPNAEIVFKQGGTPASDLPERIDGLLPP